MLSPPFYTERASSEVQSLSALVLKLKNSIACSVLSPRSGAKGVGFLCSNIFLSLNLVSVFQHGFWSPVLETHAGFIYFLWSSFLICKFSVSALWDGITWLPMCLATDIPRPRMWGASCSSGARLTFSHSGLSKTTSVDHCPLPCPNKTHT